MAKPKKVPCCLTIAGSDSGGGAGVQADLNTFAALGVHGTSAVTCLTAQNPREVLAVQSSHPDMVEAQVAAVAAEFDVLACKTGMLYDRAIIERVASLFPEGKRFPLVVDPVSVATSGARLLKLSALNALRNQLLPRALVVTPNVPEAEALTGLAVRSPEALRTAARSLHEKHGCAVVVTGGHLKGLKESVDLFYDGTTELMLTAPRVARVRAHGSGCTFAAALTAFLALGHALPKAVGEAKEYVTGAIRKHRRVGRHAVLNWRWQER